MEHPPRKTQSVDGFIPRSPQTRYVGFDNRQNLNGRLQGVRVRRPGFYGQATPPAARSATPTAPSPASFTPRSSSIDAPINQLSEHWELPKPQPMAPQARPKSKRGRLKKIVKSTSLVAAVFLLLCGGWLGWKLFRDTSKVFGSSSSLLGFLSASSLNCENTGRCNILLAGNSADDPGHDGANLTDSIMLISIDVKHNTAFMLSIPRDLYVSIPGNGYAKINEAYPDGQSEHFRQNGYAKGGMGLLEETVSQVTGVPINYYALIDYSALREGVNTVGGVPIHIQSDDPRGLYDPSIDYATHGPLVKLTNGWHTLNGEQALDLARARGDSYGSYGFSESDFERAQNQRELLLALKDKATSSSTLANPIKLGQLFDAFGNNVHTNLSAGNVRRLYDLSKSINSTSIKSYGLNSVNLSGQQKINLLANYQAPNGESTLIPAAGAGDYDQIQLYIKQLTSTDPVVKEAANVVILNGGNTDGLALAEANVLGGKGMVISATADAPSQQPSNSIIDNSGGKDPATLKELEALFGSSVTTDQSGLTGTYPNANFIVILGQSQQLPQ